MSEQSEPKEAQLTSMNLSTIRDRTLSMIAVREGDSPPTLTPDESPRNEAEVEYSDSDDHNSQTSHPNEGAHHRLFFPKHMATPQMFHNLVKSSSFEENLSVHSDCRSVSSRASSLVDVPETIHEVEEEEVKSVVEELITESRGLRKAKSMDGLSKHKKKRNSTSTSNENIQQWRKHLAQNKLQSDIEVRVTPSLDDGDGDGDDKAVHKDIDEWASEQSQRLTRFGQRRDNKSLSGDTEGTDDDELTTSASDFLMEDGTEGMEDSLSESLSQQGSNTLSTGDSVGLLSVSGKGQTAGILPPKSPSKHSATSSADEQSTGSDLKLLGSSPLGGNSVTSVTSQTRKSPTVNETMPRDGNLAVSEHSAFTNTTLSPSSQGNPPRERSSSLTKTEKAVDFVNSPSSQSPATSKTTKMSPSKPPTSSRSKRDFGHRRRISDGVVELFRKMEPGALPEFNPHAAGGDVTGRKEMHKSTSSNSINSPRRHARKKSSSGDLRRKITRQKSTDTEEKEYEFPIALSIISTETEQRKDTFLKGSYTIYLCIVEFASHERNSQVVFRRYREFYDLHQNLALIFPEVESLYFPPKKIFGSSDPETVKTRKKELQKYLRSLLPIEGVMHSSYFLDFFEIKEEDLVMSQKPMTQKKKTMRSSDFEVLSLIGKGGYGTVYLCRKKDTEEIVALKRLRRDKMKQKNQIALVIRERDVLVLSCQSEWLVSLLYSFRDSKYLYLAMEYIPGGDFRRMLSSVGALREQDARFYFCEMLFSVHTLHQLGYIHRDLKPDNFLIDRTGHIKLTDFGLSKERNYSDFVTGGESSSTAASDPSSLQSSRSTTPTTEDGNSVTTRSSSGQGNTFQNYLDKRKENEDSDDLHDAVSHLLVRNNSVSSTASGSINSSVSTPRGFKDPSLNYSVVGSPFYMAPEICAGSGYGTEVDYWSLGCILYEMIAGYSPFWGDTPQEVMQRVLNYKSELQRPECPDEMRAYGFGMSDACWSFIEALLSPAEERLGSADFLDIIGHEFLAGVDWEHIRENKAPFVPTIESETDSKYFSKEDNQKEKYNLGTSNSGEVSNSFEQPKSMEEPKEGDGEDVGIGSPEFTDDFEWQHDDMGSYTSEEEEEEEETEGDWVILEEDEKQMPPARSMAKKGIVPKLNLDMGN